MHYAYSLLFAFKPNVIITTYVFLRKLFLLFHSDTGNIVCVHVRIA